MSKRKLLWLAYAAFPLALFEGCWGTVHNFLIHGNEIVQFVAALDQLGTV